MFRKLVFLSAFVLVSLAGFELESLSASGEQETAVKNLVQSLETLQSDPSRLKRIRNQLDAEEAAAETELRSLDRTIEELRDSLARLEKRQRNLLGPPDGAQTDGGIESARADEEGWAFQPLAKPEIPLIAGANGPTHPIDRFVSRRLDRLGLQPAPQASSEKLARRLYFDLIGFPPTPEEMDAFLKDSSPDAWGDLIDRLLADPRYGEHWARFWLDLVRYAESDGWNKDSYRPPIWRYRDYVVNSFNEDKPYPQFVREQLAGDELPDDDPSHRIATGFLRLGIYEYNQRDARSHWNDILNETTDIAGDVFLGVSMSCSRCHDHKFDPISQTDYFGLRAFFEPLIWRDDLPGVSQAEHAAWQERQEIWETATVEIRAEIDALRKPYYDRKRSTTVDKFPLDIQACFHKPVGERTSWEHQMAYLIERQFVEEGTPALESLTEEDKRRLSALEERLAEYDHLKPDPLPVVMSVKDFAGEISPTTIPKDRMKTPIPPRFLTVLAGDSPDAAPFPRDLPESAGRRTALAKWIGGSDNPLTTRLIVNRIWQQHFGRGIVPTASDFGHLGQPPTHPELLDWLTVTFIENGWRMKHLHKLILTSSTWRQSSNHPQASAQLEKDPSEDLLWRARVRRLKAEEIRDSMLRVSGELEGRIGGPSVEAEVPRRALYVKSFRNLPNPLLQSFDAANGLASVAQRNVTTTPVQALLMFNGEYTIGRSKKLAERIQGLKVGAPAEALTFAFKLVWGRNPSESELGRAITYVATAPQQESSEMDNERLVDLCHVLLNSNEFLYVD